MTAPWIKIGLLVIVVVNALVLGTVRAGYHPDLVCMDAHDVTGLRWVYVVLTMPGRLQAMYLDPNSELYYERIREDRRKKKAAFIERLQR